MNKFVFLLALLFSTVLSYSQDLTAHCPKKGTADCPIVNCPKKGTADCPYTAAFASHSTNKAKVDCPLKGTANCPIVNCSKKGTPECPWKQASQVSFASKKTNVKAVEKEIPSCCLSAN